MKNPIKEQFRSAESMINFHPQFQNSNTEGIVTTYIPEEEAYNQNMIRISNEADKKVENITDLEV